MKIRKIKPRMVTRTIPVYSVSYVLANLEARTFTDHTETVTGTLTTEEVIVFVTEKVMKANTDARLLDMSVTQIGTELYGMDELDFIAHAKKLPARKVKIDD